MRKGRCPGIYTEFHEVTAQVFRYPGAEYRKFINYDEAEAYLYQNAITVHNDTNADIVVQFDGGSRGNPGKSGSGAYVVNNKQQSWAGYKYLGEDKTNNEAEYEGLILGVQYLTIQHQQDKRILIQGDSKLVINHMQGTWKCTHKNLKPLHDRAQQLLAEFKDVIFNWIPREQNIRADRLSNDAMNEEKSQFCFYQRMQ